MDISPLRLLTGNSVDVLAKVILIPLSSLCLATAIGLSPECAGNEGLGSTFGLCSGSNSTSDSSPSSMSDILYAVKEITRT